MDLHGKVALVTGSHRGLGRAIADALIAAGAQVAAHQHTGGDFAADLAAPDAPTALVARVLDRFGRLDYLVNNAAYTPLVPEHPAGNWDAVPGFDLDRFDRTLAVNLRAPLQLALAAAQSPSLAAIVNVGSGSAERGDGSSAEFVLSKGAIPTLTQYLARRLAPRVRVNCFLPGLFATEEIAARGPSFAPRRQTIIDRTPMRRLGSPAEAAETILFLLAGNAFITGQSLMLDGGWHL
ncbi:MAG: SDR family oxidoreductase [Acidobacteria bacterium]|nr:MAG: SDR family oxidoreductase [Acidobacteriota bacterium]